MRPTPLTDAADKLAHHFFLTDLCRRLERTSPNEAEWKLIASLIKLWHCEWESGPCQRDCQCARCRAVEEAGNHDKATFDSLDKASLEMLKARVQ